MMTGNSSSSSSSSIAMLCTDTDAQHTAR